MPTSHSEESAESSLWHSEDAAINPRKGILWTASRDGDVHAGGTRGNRTRCLCAVFAISEHQVSLEPHRALRQAPNSSFPVLCSRCQGWETTPLWHMVNFSTCSPGFHPKQCQARLQLLHPTPPVKIQLTLQFPSQCCLYLRSCLPITHSTPAKSVS
jgi:hypothetical protein